MKIHGMGPPHGRCQITWSPVRRHCLRQLGPSVQQETHLLAPVLACPLDNLCLWWLSRTPILTLLQWRRLSSGAGEAQCVQGSLHYSGYLRVQDQKLSNPPNEKEKCPQGEMSNCSEQQSFAGFPPSSTPRGYVHKGQPVLPPLHVSHWALLPGAADLKPRAR